MGVERLIRQGSVTSVTKCPSDADLLRLGCSEPGATNLETRDVLRELADSLSSIGVTSVIALWMMTDKLSLIESYDYSSTQDHPVPLTYSEATVIESINSGEIVLKPVMVTESGSTAFHHWIAAVPIKLNDSFGAVSIEFKSWNDPDKATLLSQILLHRLSLIGCLSLAAADRRTKVADAALTLLQTLSKCSSADDVLRTSLEHAIALSGATTASVLRLNASDNRLYIFAAKGLSDHVVKSTSIALGEGVAGWVAATGQSLIVEDLIGDGSRQSPRQGVKSSLSLPIKDDTGLIGVLNIGSDRPGTFNAGIRELFNVLVQHTAVHWRLMSAVASSTEIHLDSLRRLALTMEILDPASSSDSTRMIELASHLGRSLGLPTKDQQALESAALLYDLGMASTGLERNRGYMPMSTVERAALRMHPEIGARMTRSALPAVSMMISHHHERYDGGGYPSGLAGDEIPIGARVLAVVDAFVAMTSSRPYRTTRTTKAAIDELKKHAGSQFDPHVVDLFISNSNLERTPDHTN